MPRYIIFVIAYILCLSCFVGYILQRNIFLQDTFYFENNLRFDIVYGLWIHSEVGCILWLVSFCVDTHFLCKCFLWKLFVETFVTSLFLFSLPCSPIIYFPLY